MMDVETDTIHHFIRRGNGLARMRTLPGDRSGLPLRIDKTERTETEIMFSLNRGPSRAGKKAEKKGDEGSPPASNANAGGRQSLWLKERMKRPCFALSLIGTVITLLSAWISLHPHHLFVLLDYKIHDLMVRNLPVKTGHGRPVIIDLDEKSLAETGQWPWPRYRVARLLDTLTAMGVRCVGLDMLFAEPDRTSPRVIREQMRRELGVDFEISGLSEALEDNDRLLARTLAKGPFVLGFPFFFEPHAVPGKNGCPGFPLAVTINRFESGGLGDFRLHHAEDATCNLKPLRDAAGAAGFINALPDEDGVLRRSPLVIRHGGNLYPSLALATVLRALDLDRVSLKVVFNEPEYLEIPTRSAPIRVPLDGNGNLLIRYYLRDDFFEYISASDILNDRIPSRRLAGRIAFFGASAPGLGDIHPTPLKPVVPGVEFHATVVENILSGEFLYVPWWRNLAECCAVLVIGAITTLLLIWRRTFTSFLLLSTASGGIWLGSASVFVGHGLFISPLFPLIALGANFSVLTLTKVIGADLKSREQRKELLQAQELTIQSLASLAETRDNETGDHLVRTQYYVRRLAEYLSVHPRPHRERILAEDIDYLTKCAPLHDIGKVGIPDAILLKPGKLTDEEFAIMKSHATIGKTALSRAEERVGNVQASPYFRFAREMTYSHHEKWDGTGYPEGLKGEAIPLAGRLMALADVYDALRTQRVYKPAFPHEKARAIILEGRGRHFDPAVVDAFLAIEDEFIHISEKYADVLHEEKADAPGGGDSANTETPSRKADRD